MDGVRELPNVFDFVTKFLEAVGNLGFGGIGYQVFHNDF